ncbi:MAG: box helicase [Bacteroidota bacterium]|jgi:superfamily II DNA or RNA helicase|nr:box helicase [Bacteroidota bacterium]
MELDEPNITPEPVDIEEKKIGKQLYDYQQEAINRIFNCLNNHTEKYNLLFQLPTGGGKTVIFSEIAKRYIKESGKKVLILTHRIELCAQTSDMLNEFGVKNKIIDSKVKTLPDQEEYMCFVAMVETLNNRLQDEKLEVENVGLVIIDEAHFNSFKKLFKFLEKSVILGVTATPLSSNIKLPMKETYNELIVGHSIPELIEKGFLSKATTYSYDVNLGSLKVGIDGDYTVSSSDRLYTNSLMQEKLVAAYEEQSKGKKTLIFNNGINTSKHVELLFKNAGYDIRHLDNTNSEQERKAILTWFKTKPDAILTSVGILTTGFDEPTVETIILNRATKSLTLYHQMIGRGSRVLPNKSTFTVIDLGNNAARFGLWDSFVNWHEIFRSPDMYLENLRSDQEIERQLAYKMPAALRARFSKSEDIDFSMKDEYERVAKEGLRPKIALERSINQHSRIIFENSENFDEAQELVRLLEEDIRYRIKKYSYCIAKSTDNYLKWLQDEYQKQLSSNLSKKFLAAQDTNVSNDQEFN